MKKRTKKFIMAAVLLAAAGLLYYVLNRYLGFVVPCVFFKLTGLYCPGCGVTGMLIDLLHFDFAGAFRHNQALFIALPFILYLLIKLFVGYIKRGSMTLGKADNCIAIILIVWLVVFGVLRNLPFLYCLKPY